MPIEEKPLWLKTRAEDVVLEVRLLHQAAWLLLVRLWPMFIHSTIGRWVWIYLILYVDESQIYQAEIGKLKRSLHDKFVMKELGQARNILGMRIERNRTDSPTLPVRLHLQSVEALQQGECEANTNTASDVNSTIGQRLSFDWWRERAQWKDNPMHPP